MTKQKPFDRDAEKVSFENTFEAINEALGEEAFRHLRNGKHVGAFSVYVFDALSIGVAKNLNNLKDLSSAELKKRCIAVKSATEFRDNVGAGANTQAKMKARLEAAIRLIGRGI